MELSDRLFWLLVGIAIGGVLGYIVRSLQEIKKELHDVDEIVTKNAKNESGVMRFPIISDIILFLVLLLCVYASVSAGNTNNKLANAQERIDDVTSCTQEYLSKTILALNERTEYSTEQARSNVALQRSQSEFLAILLLKPPASDERVSQALADYFDNLNEFVNIAGKTADKAQRNPYPTTEELQSCLATS